MCFGCSQMLTSHRLHTPCPLDATSYTASHIFISIQLYPSDFFQLIHPTHCLPKNTESAVFPWVRDMCYKEHTLPRVPSPWVGQIQFLPDLSSTSASHSSSSYKVIWPPYPPTHHHFFSGYKLRSYSTIARPQSSFAWHLSLVLSSFDQPTHQQNCHSFALVINNHSQNTSSNPQPLSHHFSQLAKSKYPQNTLRILFS